MKDKIRQCVYLAKDKEEIDFAIETGKIKSDKQIRILTFLKENEAIEVTDLEIYTDTSRAILKTLEKNGYIEIVEKVIKRNPFLHKDIKRDSKLELNEEQKIAYHTIEQAIHQKRHEKFLIYGITGSGKTEIYLQLIEKVRNEGKTAIVLVPEISLTPQMVDRFIARFGQDTIAVLHSRLSLGERHDSWKKIKEKSASIIIRSKIGYLCTSF